MKVRLHGFGTTPALWPEGGPQLRFDDLAREAKRVGGGLSAGTELIGWSMGGMVALLVAAWFPEKVSQLVLASTTPKFIAANDWPFGLPLALLRRLERRIKVEGIRAFHSLVFPDGHSAGLADLTSEQALRELAALEKVDLRSELGAIKAPTLIIHGDQDDICLPGAAGYLHSSIAGSDLVMLPGVGHALMVERPERFAELVNGHAG